MKIATLLLLAFFIIPAPEAWLTNFEKAQKIAAENHQLILLNFSGSDWCGPCIRLKKEIFESKVFTDFADSNLVLVNADFPRSNKNKPGIAQVKQNESMADRYNSKGKFPLTLLINPNGTVIKEWDGLPEKGPALLVEQLRVLCNEHK